LREPTKTGGKKQESERVGEKGRGRDKGGSEEQGRRKRIWVKQNEMRVGREKGRREEGKKIGRRMKK